MISEKTFCSHYSNFWRETLPNLEAVVRGINLGYERVWNPLGTVTDPKRRDLISESGYRLFFYMTDVAVQGDLPQLTRKAAKEAFDYLTSRSVDLWNEVDAITEYEEREIVTLATRLKSYFGIHTASDIPPIRPAYSGHGIMAGCHGDFERSGNLIEMKYVTRGFRGNDLRQILTYASLKYYMTGREYSKIGLLNPLLGTHFITTANEIVAGASGMSSVEFFKRMSYALSSGEISH